MTVKGKLHEIFETKQITDTFKKREFILEYIQNPDYPQYVKFELVQDNCFLIDEFKVGDEVEVQFDLKGRIWTNPEGEKVYFTTLGAYKITRLTESDSNLNHQDDFLMPDTSEDDLPF